MSEKKSILKDKSFAFALQCVKLYKYLTEAKKEFVLSKQLLRSGTSVGANIREAQNAQSTADFIHKLSIAQKECDETIYWLELLNESEYVTKSEFEPLKNEANQILKMLRSSILTSKQKSHNS
ncbi:MAG: four helix bundle protein [Flavobacterium sp.]